MGLDDKGIASAELIFATLIFLIVITSLLNLTSTEMTKNQTAELGEVRIAGERIASAINTVFINGPGYAANVTLPSDLTFTADVSTNGSLTMNYKGNSTVIKLIPKNVTSVTMNPGQKYLIKNVNGTITFTLL